MKSLKNKDVIIFIALIPIINAINYFITYSDVTFNSYFLLTFLIDTIQGYFAWLIIRFIILKLEKSHPFLDFTWSRLLKQLFLTCSLGLLVIIITTEILNFIFKTTPVPSSFYKHDIFIYLIWILVINGIYIGIYYYNIWKNSEEILSKERTLKTDGVTVKIGDKNIKIPLNSINGFYVEGGFTFVIDQQSRTNIVDGSLESLESKLPKQLFYRVNRKYLLNRSTIVSFKRIDDGKLELSIALDNDHFPSTIKMSRLKAPDFKKWFSEDLV